MTDDWPKTLSRRPTKVSPWVTLIEREVQFSPGGRPEAYHSLAQADYVAIVALTPDGLIPIVRQYRPAVEAFTWELPAGLVDAGEDPVETCRRELLEETGFPARAVHCLGAAVPCTGRLSNRIHSFFVEAGARLTNFISEQNVAVRLVSPEELARLIDQGEFVSQLHLGSLLLAELGSHITLPRAKR